MRVSNKSTLISDAKKGNFVEKFPTFLQPFAQLARWDRPIGWWLLLLPCWWSEALAARMVHSTPDFFLLFLFMIGAIAMRGAGSTWNDIADREIDAKVKRTAGRPLPSGRISMKFAYIFLILQLIVGLMVLLFLTNFAKIIALISIAPVLIYPFMKRITNYPQFVLGLAFAWGAWMGFASHYYPMPIAAPILYFGSVLWVIGYDTIYALQDLEDDILIGVGSTARAFGNNSKIFITICYLSTITLIGYSLFLVKVTIFAWIGFFAFASHLMWQVITLKQDDEYKALVLFRSNRNAGLFLFIGCLIDAILVAKNYYL